MLRLSNISAERDERILFKEVSATLIGGDCQYIIGPNGTGKTTLLRIICGLTAPLSGEIEWNGFSTRHFREKYCQDLLYLGHKNANKAELSCYENLRIGMGLEGISISEDEIEAALEDAGLIRLAHMPARFLSQGQQRKLAMVKLSISRAKLWILDEPYSALDSLAIHWLDQKIDNHLKNGGIAIITSHQPLSIKTQFKELNLELYYA